MNPKVPDLDVNYHHTLQEQGWRGGLRPLNVVQPQGPSFEVASLAASQPQTGKGGMQSLQTAACRLHGLEVAGPRSHWLVGSRFGIGRAVELHSWQR